MSPQGFVDHVTCQYIWVTLHLADARPVMRGSSRRRLPDAPTKEHLAKSWMDTLSVNAEVMQTAPSTTRTMSENIWVVINRKLADAAPCDTREAI